MFLKESSMSISVIACSMMEDEIRLAMQEAGCNYPIQWIERGLHEYPNKLHEKLSHVIAETGADIILLAFCLCGNATIGIGSKTASLVLPRFDDCIHMLRSFSPGDRGQTDSRSLYYTRGWINSDRFIACEYQNCINKYGLEKAKRIYKMMLENYKSALLMDTSAFDTAECKEKVSAAAKVLGLDFSMTQGSVRVLTKLFRGEWDEEFCVLHPGEYVTESDYIHTHHREEKR
jgi:hypothetical protein